MINSLLIANRGEIAVRIIRSAKEMGIHTVQVFSEADQDSQAVHLADEAICIGPPIPARSYLDIDGILEAAKKTNSDAIHPGYGFLAENADFVKAVESSGLYFVGPSAETVSLMGDKIAARRAALAAGVPIIPGSSDPVDDAANAARIAQDIGFPVMIKASAGGGGRGIRQVSNSDELAGLIPAAQREAMSAFGDSGLFIEKAVANARHIEIQIVGDGTEVIHLFERDCSIQRRKQKLWEEAPAPDLPVDIRMRICDAATSLLRKIGYRGVGTVEFIYDVDSSEFFFLEVNTRIQVEHPVTEMITGVDLVRLGLLIASGVPLQLCQEEVQYRGHAIEVRINAEDPENEFFPCPGTVSSVRVPDGPGVRFDSMLYPGYEIPPFYDSLLGKLIIWDEDRESAINRLDRALAELCVGGVKTTTSLFRRLVKDDQIRKGPVTTLWLENWLRESDTEVH